MTRIQPIPQGFSRIVVVVLVTLALAGCRDPMDSLRHENRRPLDPPIELYRKWWTELEDCVSLERDLGGIRWFVADRVGFNSRTKGQWSREREITLLAGEERAMRIVKHEMLHDLLDGDGDHDHEVWGDCDRRVGD